jgi:demethylmenaquinone methyltransferase/2-methoxy-6-polyprenyl-1,4-benzoquinol methylase
MKITPDEIYDMRKRFFNDQAGNWLDMWYRDPGTGKHDKHEKDFERLFSLMPIRAGDHVLDAGCGTGILVPFIVERIGEYGVLYELDFAEKMLEINRSLHEADNVRFILSEAEKAPFGDGSCDMVICFSCFPHFHDRECAVKALSRTLKSGGFFIVAHFDSSEGISRHHSSCDAVRHDHLPDERAMRSLLESADLAIEMFIDEPGFYCIIGKKSGLKAS